ncbi:MAG: hypothetical protein JRC91_07230, partial [Deltaproteobacteria bacterium]|nr:hypothetical protein [Deltaproteobacteria bacterium]
MALIAIVSDFYSLILEMSWHGNGLDDFFMPSLDLSVMAPQAEGGNLLFFFNGQCPDFFAIRYMICISSMTKFTGYGLMATLFMKRCFTRMTFEAGCIGPMPDGNKGCF